MNEISKESMKINYFNLPEEEDRICSVLIPDELVIGKTDPPSVTLKYLKKYYDFLSQTVPKGSMMTGDDIFEWWEVISENPVEELSIDDIFSLVSFEEIHKELGIIVLLKREIDGSLFKLPLNVLKIFKNNARGYQEIQDYSSWYCNYL